MGSLTKLGSLTIVVGLAMGLSACKSFDGQITATETLKLQPKSKKGASVVPAGTSNVTISFPSKKKIKMEIRVAGDNNNIEAEFKVPKGAILPENGGAVQLLAKDSGQPYDIVGNNDVQITRSSPVRDVESCSIEVRDRVCDVVIINGVSQRKCRDVVRTVSGRKDVEYYHRYEHDTLELELLSPADGHSVAHATAHWSGSDKIYTYQGQCIVNGGWHPGGPFVDIR